MDKFDLEIPEHAYFYGLFMPDGNTQEDIVIVWHCCSYRKLQRYLKTGCILPPVRAWETIEQAQRMSISTGRKIILRLRFPDDAQKLEGHFNQARVLTCPLKLDSFQEEVCLNFWGV